MKEQVLAAMPKCFENWCRCFDDVFSRQKQRQEFRTYLGGLLGESQRKNLTQIATNTVDGSYNSLRHFLNDAPWQADKLNERRLKVMHQCRQTTPKTGFTLIVDDSGVRRGVRRAFVPSSGVRRGSLDPPKGSPDPLTRAATVKVVQQLQAWDGSISVRLARRITV